MISSAFNYEDRHNQSRPREGMLYKVVDLHGHRFPLYYGYYEEWERENPAEEPMPIYPDFLKQPRYTAEGFPFVTKMQDPCKYYRGREGDFNDCGECSHYLHGDELLGICVCPENRQSGA